MITPGAGGSAFIIMNEGEITCILEMVEEALTPLKLMLGWVQEASEGTMSTYLLRILETSLASVSGWAGGILTPKLNGCWPVGTYL